MSDGKDLNQQILEKLDRLERRYRRLKTSVTLGLVAGALAVTGMFALPEVSAQLEQQELDAQTLVIRDREGNRRVIVGVNRNGDAGIWVLNERGESRVVMSAGPISRGETPSGIWIHNQRGQQRVVLTTDERHSGVWVSNQGTNHQIRMRVEGDQPELVFRDSRGQDFYQLP